LAAWRTLLLSSSIEVGTRDASASGTTLAGFFLAVFGARFRATLGDQLVARRLRRQPRPTVRCS
jgi:hypothetical protein